MKLKVEVGGFHPRIAVSESLRVTPQGFSEDHLHGRMTGWSCIIIHAVCLHAGTGTSLRLYEVRTTCRSSLTCAGIIPQNKKALAGGLNWDYVYGKACF